MQRCSFAAGKKSVFIGPQPSGPSASCSISCSFGGWAGGCVCCRNGSLRISSFWCLDALVFMGRLKWSLSEPGEQGLDMFLESQRWGRLSAFFMLLYFFVGPYINIFKFNAPVLPSLVVPSIGIALMVLVIGLPRHFRSWSVLFLIYSTSILVLTV